jgi:hypothetical protein
MMALCPSACRPLGRPWWSALVEPMRAEIAALDAALAPRRAGQLLLHLLVDEGARLVRAGHDAVAAADAGVPVHHHDAVGAFERGAGGADVDARRVLAVLTHQRQVGHVAADVVLQLDLADPDRALVLPLGSSSPSGSDCRFRPFSCVAGLDAGGAAVGALGCRPACPSGDDRSLQSELVAGEITARDISYSLENAPYLDLIQPESTTLSFYHKGDLLHVRVEGKAKDLTIGARPDAQKSVKPTIIEHLAKNGQANLIWNWVLGIVGLLGAVMGLLPKKKVN